jgi:hypothetical protein
MGKRSPGHIEQLPSGSWRVKVYGGTDPLTGREIRLRKTWELSTLAAAWHHAYSGPHPDLARALEFYDRWLPGTMRRIAAITRTCVPECAMRRRSW